MKKRGIIFHLYQAKYLPIYLHTSEDYDTAYYGWTLTGLSLTAPEQKTNYVEKPNGDGTWDMSTAMTNGWPRYKDRTLTATFEYSEGSREDREEMINIITNLLDGLICNIFLPDRPNHYLQGRTHVSVDTSNLAYCAITITATVGPWFTANKRSKVSYPITGDSPFTCAIRNYGRRVEIPTITLDHTVSCLLEFRDITLATQYQTISPGTTTIPALALRPGKTEITCIPSSAADEAGEIVFRFWEAVLR